MQNLNSKSTELILIAILLLAFLFTALSIRDYGASFDEPLIYDYASSIPNIYKRALFSQSNFDFTNIGDLGFYGTGYFIIGELAQRALGIFIQTLDVYDRWHLINFSVFLSSVWVLYWLCVKFSSKISGLIVSLLYLTQPLLWGHGVMNPKDTPFAAFFLFSVAAGVKMVDELKNPSSTKFKLKLKSLQTYNRWYSYVIAFFSGLVILDRFSRHLIASPLLYKFFSVITNLPGSSQIKKYILSKAHNFDTLQINLYVSKFLQQISFFESIFIILAFLILILWLIHKFSTAQRWILIAATCLGFTISIRFLGPAAGALVLVYMLMQINSKKLIPDALLYIVVVIFITYLSWPFLWTDPIGQFLESLKLMAQFPWLGAVLFEGKEVLANTLPWYYLPKLIGIQLSIPVIILGLVGTLYAIFSIKKNDNKSLFVIALIWFYIPLLIWMIIKPNTYDNFRQFLFLLPPFFLFVSIGVSLLFSRMKKKSFKVLLSVVLLIPGFIAGIYLHPYEYIYYNGLVGWTSNIDNRYESDYWATSFCEAGQYLDPLIEHDTQIAFTDGILSRLTLRCIRNSPDVLIEREENSKIYPTYSINWTRYGDDKDYFRWMKPIKIIKIGATELVVIKKVP